jgi:hypothetical protein
MFRCRPRKLPFPLEPLSVKWVASVTVIVWSPFAAVLPRMPARIARWPVDKPCGATVPIEIGEVQLAYPTARFWTVLKNHHRNSPNWSHGVKPDSSRRNYVLFPQGNYGTLWVSRAGPRGPHSYLP